MKKYVALSVNMDSLRQAVGYKNIEHDYFYFEALDKILKISKKFNLPLTIFVIGKDLEYPEIASRIKDLFYQGHEIANHSYSHPQNFGYLTIEQQISEILQCNDKIFKTIGIYPEGFLAPGWSTSYQLLKYLNRNGFTHDSSYFSSVLMIFIKLRLILGYIINFLRFKKLPQTYKLREAFNRRDFFINLRSNDKPFVFGDDHKTVELPLPIVFRFIPYWFSIEFFNRRIAKFIFGKLLKKEFTHLLVHPADFANVDMIARYAKENAYSIYRSHTDKTEFIVLFEERVKAFLDAGFEFITMKEMAKKISDFN
jgi:hypothetical protein